MAFSGGLILNSRQLKVNITVRTIPGWLEMVLVGSSANDFKQSSSVTNGVWYSTKHPNLTILTKLIYIYIIYVIADN